MIAAIIQARMGSTRLPGKVLKRIKGKTLLEILVERLQQARKLDKIIIATSNNPRDKEVVELAQKLGLPHFAGSEEDVLDRFYQTAKKFGVDTIVRVTGDCPFHDPEIVDELVEFYQQNKDRYDYVSNVDPPSFPDGLDLWIFSFATLKKAWREAKLASEREHVCPYIWKNPDKFRIGHLRAPQDYSRLRWTVDDADDFEFVKNVFERLDKKGVIFHITDVLELLEKHPELHEIQKGKIRDAGYLKSLREDKEINENKQKQITN